MHSGKTLIMSDFDETIVNIDTAEYALERFADPSWKLIEERFESGKISFEKSLRDEFAMLKVNEQQILEELDKVVVFRPNFDKLVDSCRKNRLPLIIVSGGLEFCIRHFLGRTDWLEFVEIYAPKATYTPSGYELSFPKLLGTGAVNFKDDLVRYHKRQSDRVFFIGDGTGDFPAARAADFPFAIKGSRLAEACRNEKVAHKEISDFQEVVDAIGELKN
jgi:2-hydroxy-3-keto-5-methylthiopentenyl-1-phosphate phosphatase